MIRSWKFELLLLDTICHQIDVISLTSRARVVAAGLAAARLGGTTAARSCGAGRSGGRCGAALRVAAIRRARRSGRTVGIVVSITTTTKLSLLTDIHHVTPEIVGDRLQEMLT